MAKFPIILLIIERKTSSIKKEEEKNSQKRLTENYFEKREGKKLQRTKKIKREEKNEIKLIEYTRIYYFPSGIVLHLVFF